MHKEGSHDDSHRQPSPTIIYRGQPHECSALVRPGVVYPNIHPATVSRVPRMVGVGQSPGNRQPRRSDAPLYSELRPASAGGGDTLALLR